MIERIDQWGNANRASVGRGASSHSVDVAPQLHLLSRDPRQISRRGAIADSAVAGAARPYAAIKRPNFGTQRRTASWEMSRSARSS
jgi:hypothetical protein